MSEADKAFTGSIAEAYDRYLGPMLFEPFAREMAARFAGFEGDVLETAAGTGRLTRALAETAPGARIVATDLNEPMLAHAGEAVGARNVQWRQADAQALPFADASFDAVLCQFGVMFLPDRAAGYGEALRVLRPGGRFVFSVWDRMAANEVTLAAHEALAALFADDPPRFYARVPFAYHDAGTIRRELGEAGFGEVRIETVRLETRAASARDAAIGLCMGSPLRSEIEALHPGRLADAVEAVTGALSQRFGEGSIAGPGQALVVSASRP